MQPSPSHHWCSSLLTGLCIVAGFGLGLFWHECRSSSMLDGDRPLPATVGETEPVDTQLLCYAGPSAEDDNNLQEPKSSARQKPRSLTPYFVRPHTSTEPNLKRVEEALRRAQEALEQDGQELPEEFRKHFDNLRMQMLEHHKQMEEHFRKMDFQFPNGRGFEGFPEKFPGKDGFPQNNQLFRSLDSKQGSGVSIVLSRTNGRFTVERRKGMQLILVTGTLVDGKGLETTFTIKEGEKEKTYKDLKEVPADLQGQVKELVEMVATGRFQVRPSSSEQRPKNRDKRESSEQCDFF